MKRKNVLQKLSALATVFTFLITAAAPLSFAQGIEDEDWERSYGLYYYQLKDYEGGTPWSEMMTLMAKAANNADPSCNQTTRYVGNQIDTIEAMSERLAKFVNDTSPCIEKISSTGQAYQVDYTKYGTSGIVAYYRTLNYNMATIEPIELEETEEEEVVEEVTEDIAPEIVEEVIEEVVEEEAEQLVEDTPIELEPPVAEEEPEEQPRAVESIVTTIGDNGAEVHIELEDGTSVEGDVAPERITEDVELIERQKPRSTKAATYEQGKIELEEDEILEALEEAKEDADNNGMLDSFEALYGLEGDEALPEADPDGDGLTNAQEQEFNTHPRLSDTDGDGVSDADEINIHGTSPLSTDSDGDGLSDELEIQMGSDPNSKNSDGDAFSDAYEYRLRGPEYVVDESLTPDDDEWEKSYDLTYENGYETSSIDGCSYEIKSQYGLDPNQIGSVAEICDNTLIDHIVEVKEFKNGKEIVVERVLTQLLNVVDGDVLKPELLPIRGSAAEEHEIAILAVKDGVTTVIAQDIAGEKNRFVAEPIVVLPEGEYALFVQVFDKQGIPAERSAAINVTLKDVEASAPVVSSISDFSVENSGDKAINLETEEEELELVFKGTAGPSDTVVLISRSLVLSAGVVADAKTGYFEIAPAEAKLARGEHDAWLYTIDSETGVKSPSTYIDFSIGEVARADVINAVNVDSEHMDGTSKMILIFVGLVLSGLAVVITRRRLTSN